MLDRAPVTSELTILSGNKYVIVSAVDWLPVKSDHNNKVPSSINWKKIGHQVRERTLCALYCMPPFATCNPPCPTLWVGTPNFLSRLHDFVQHFTTKKYVSERSLYFPIYSFSNDSNSFKINSKLIQNQLEFIFCRASLPEA